MPASKMPLTIESIKLASLKNMIQDKTNCSSESIQHTESTNLNIFRIKGTIDNNGQNENFINGESKMKLKN